MATGKRTDREQSHRSPSEEATLQAPDAPTTDHQRERLKILSAEADVPFEDGLTRARSGASDRRTADQGRI